MNKLVNKIVASKFWWLLLLVFLFGINFLASIFHTRFDLTKEKRYTLSNTTKELLYSLDEDIQIDVFLKGDFPSGFQKLANSTREFLQLLKERNSARIEYRFISPKEEVPGANGFKYGDSLVSLGYRPINLTVQLKEGQQQNYIFPVALVHYKGRQQLIDLYGGSNRFISQNEINEAEALLEYQFVSVLDKLINDTRPAVAYATGNGEPEDARTYDLRHTLEQEYRFAVFNLGANPVIPDIIQVLIIVKPSLQFSDQEKLKLDQFIMRGGKLICFIDNLFAETDSLGLKSRVVAYDRNLNLEDLFFRYGARINTDLVMDLQCEVIPFEVRGGSDGPPQYEFLHWNYYPIFTSPGNHPINSNLGPIGSRFVNSMDTINVPGIRKTILLSSSPSSRKVGTPAVISLNENRNAPIDENFKMADIPVAVLLEGRFTSLYRNQVSQAEIDSLTAHNTPFRPSSEDNKMIIVADGDMVLNEFVPGREDGQPPQPLPMGWNRDTYMASQLEMEAGKLFIPVANGQFIQNCIEYLIANPAIIQTRNKNIILRLLDPAKVRDQRTTWQFINIVLPILLVILAGFIYREIRKRKYA